MPKPPRLPASEAERKLLARGFVLLCTKGSHRIYFRDADRGIVPFHRGKVLPVKIMRELLSAMTKI